MLKKNAPELSLLLNHYRKRLGKVNLKLSTDTGGIHQIINFNSPVLKKGNQPRIYYHGKSTKDVIILAHGLSDSPYYIKAIGKKFYKAGCNVIITLLPGHGLKVVGEKMEDHSLKRKWKKEIDVAVEAAAAFGNRISLGGFSTGAVLAINKAIRNPEQIKGGLFLFAAALDLGYVARGSSYIPFAHTIARYTDGEIESMGTNPYRYPYVNNTSGLQVVRLVDETWKRLEKKKLDQPVFIAHTIHDARINFSGIFTFIKSHVKKAFTFFIAEDIQHSQLVLKKPIKLDLSKKHGVREIPQPNPKFNWMMQNAIHYFKSEVVGKNN